MTLTPRQQEVVLGIADGETRKAIAVRLGISPKTVSQHVAAAALRFRTHTIAGTVAAVLREEAMRFG